VNTCKTLFEINNFIVFFNQNETFLNTKDWHKSKFQENRTVNLEDDTIT